MFSPYPSRQIILLILILSSVFSILISIIILEAGYNTVFQNLFYLPIIIACIFYLWRGLLFSCFLSLTYFILIICYTQDIEFIQLAFIRVILFVVIAGVITVLSSTRNTTLERLQESENRYHSLFENMLDGYAYCRMIYDEQNQPVDFVYLEVNKSFEEMRRITNVEGKHVLNLIAGMIEQNPDLLQVFNRVAISGIPEKFEFSLYDSQFWFSIAVYSSEKGHFVAFFDNITEQRHAEQALLESNQKLRLLTGLSRHDTFNQLGGMYLSLDMAMEASDLSESQEFIRKAQESGARIENIIGFTREFEDFGTTSSEWQDIHQIIDSATGEIRLEGFQVNNEIPVNLQIYADPIIRKVFSTLMENAIRHGGQISEIRFSWYKKDESIILIGEDDGKGIPILEKELIFNHGYGKHTGIGLFVAREILSITGLTIKETGEEGRGARFEILVPAGKFRFNR